MVISKVEVVLLALAIAALGWLLPSQSNSLVKSLDYSPVAVELSAPAVQQRESEEITLNVALPVPQAGEPIHSAGVVEKPMASAPAKEAKPIDRAGDGRDFDFSSPADRAMAEQIFQALNSPALNPAIQNTASEQMRDLGVLLTLPLQVN